MTEHTPGPWQESSSDLSILGNPERTGFDDLVIVAICEPSDPCAAPLDQQQANARLIASAPDLLEVLKGICCRVMGNSTGSFTIGVGHIKAARAAIAKAEGPTP